MIKNCTLKRVGNLKSAFYFTILLLAGHSATAQQIVWADKVIKFSSETGTKSYSASQILGKPNTSPDSVGNAWRPNSHGKPETIEVAFTSTMKAQQLFIIESLNPGFIKSVVVKNSDGIEFPVASYTSKASIKGPRLLTINLADYSMNISSAIITLVPIRNVSVTIDAVGLTNSGETYKLVNSIQLEMVVKAAPLKVDTAATPAKPDHHGHDHSKHDHEKHDKKKK